MNAIEKIRAEIERLQEKHHSFIVDCYCKELLSFLDILQEPEIDLEEEIKTWIPTHIKAEAKIKEPIIKWGENLARYFYELGKNVAICK